MSTDIEFINGLIFKLRAETTPDYVLANFSIKRLDLIEWLQSRDEEWINGQAKVAKSGKPYAAVDNWKPKGEGNTGSPARRAPDPRKADELDDIPFITNTGIF